RFFLQAEDGIRYPLVTGVQTCALPIFDRAKGAIAVVSKGWDRGVEAPLRWSADASAIHCLAQDRARQHLFRFDLASRAPTALVKIGRASCRERVWVCE